MRIITGKYKGRHFDIPRTFKARPTTDFAKENIFNVLTQYIDFEDTEALDHHRFIQQCVGKLLGSEECETSSKVTSPSTIIRGDVFRYIKSCKQQFDFIFADPPYALKELPTIPRLIFERGLLKDDGIFVFEHGKDYDFSDDPHFVEHRSYGSVNFSIFRTKVKASV